MRRYFRILTQFWKATLMQSMEYRTSFFLSMGANAVDFTFGLVQYALFFTVAENVAGWEMPQLLAFYGVFMTMFSLYFIILYPNLDPMTRLVNTGQLDLVLTKPVSTQILLSFRRLSLEESGSFLASQILLWVLIFSGQVQVTPLRFLAFLVGMFSGLAIIYSLFLFFMALTLWFEKMEDLADLIWSLFGICRYPVDVFPRALKWLFYGLVPAAFVTTVPARILVAGEQPEMIFRGFAIAVAWLIVSRLAWKQALKGYTSAGG